MNNDVKYYIGVGASAGGLEAITALFENFPRNSGLAFIVVQHLSPDHKSLMPELLAKRTILAVEEVSQGMGLKPDHIYLAPPTKNITIREGRLCLQDKPPKHTLNLPVDLLFQSLADDQKEKAVAIVLSGTGTDGTRGVRRIKEMGGIVIAQNEQSAKFDGMPRSVITTGLADYILSPEEIAERLVAYANHQSEPLPPALKSGELEIDSVDHIKAIFSLLRNRFKHDFTFYKPSTVLRRIERRMSVTQIPTHQEYADYLAANPEELRMLYKELLIGVTNFFRDSEVFETLENSVLPEFLTELPTQQSEVRIWVAGCSTGEEAYTLAMLFMENIDTLGLPLGVKVFATDVDEAALDFASIGRYPESVAADIPNRYLNKYFMHRDDTYIVSRALREKVVFAKHNVVKDPPFTNLNFISCRNLLIYFQPILQRKALEYFNFALSNHGLMLLGASESTGDMQDSFKPVHMKWNIFRSLGNRRLISSLSLQHTEREQSQGHESAIASMSAHKKLYNQERLQERLLNLIGKEFFEFAIVINSELELLHSVGNTRDFISLPNGMISADIGKLLIKELALPVTTSIKKCLNTGKSIAFNQIHLQKLDGRYCEYRLFIRRMDQERGQVPLVAAFLVSSQQEAHHDNVDSVYNLTKEAETRIADLEQELQFNRESLQATVEELETSNEELQATNEELLSSNEELQSTNEELQSVNEELYTVNAEYQSKIMELTETTNDLDNLLDNTEIGTLFLDEDMEIRRFSSRVAELFNIIDSDIGRSIFHLSHNIKDLDIRQFLDEVNRGTHTIEREFSYDNRWFILRGLPYRISESQFAGIVLTTVEVTRIKQAEQTASEKSAFAQGILDALEIPAFFIDQQGYLQLCNPQFESLIGRGRHQLLRQKGDEVLPTAIQDYLQQGDNYLNIHSDTDNYHSQLTLETGRYRGKLSRMEFAHQTHLGMLVQLQPEPCA